MIGISYSRTRIDLVDPPPRSTYCSKRLRIYLAQVFNVHYPAAYTALVRNDDDGPETTCQGLQRGQRTLSEYKLIPVRHVAPDYFIVDNAVAVKEQSP